MGTTKKHWVKRAIAFIILLLVAVLVSQVVNAYYLPTEASLRIGDNTFNATIADTDETRIKGLSGTRHLAANHAMLFVYDDDTRHGIWMKDMHYSIDVVWLDKSKQVVDFVANVTPESYPKVFEPKEDSRYIVELRSGMIEEKGIEVGQEAAFSGSSGEL